jgi:ATP-dependent DNA helicase RecG
MSGGQDAVEQPTTPSLPLTTSVARLPGVNPARIDQLHRLGLRYVRDLLFFFPRDYHDFTDLRPIEALEEGATCSAIGTVADIDARQLRSRRTMVGVLIEQEGHLLRGIWFNQLFMREKFAFGQRVMFSGKVRRRDGRWEINHPRVEWLGDDEEDLTPHLLPLYPLTDGLKQRHLRRLSRFVLDRCASQLEETFPAPYLDQHRLWPIERALPQIHFPADRDSLHHARRRFVYQELLILQLALAVRRQRVHDLQRAPLFQRSAKIDARIRRLFPFDFTAAQNQAIAEIAGDLERSYPMNRLLQGDVGSGKTAVAVYAMLLAVAHGYQAVIMTPTEVLARQHAATLDRLLEQSQVRRTLLSGGLTASERQRALHDIASGQVELVVGTQAVLQADVQFARLGLIVIDEQHKFGVRQRARLKQTIPSPDDLPAPVRQLTFADAEAPTAPATDWHNTDPHYLVMTATPIPRTLTMTLFGDLDVSTLREPPPGRQKIHTYLVEPDRRDSWWQFFAKHLNEGRQGYVVVPLVEESDEIDAANVQSVYNSLVAGPLQGIRLGMLHGRMPSVEKLRVMKDFREREIQVLVTTTVIEVGVDIPNATLMVIDSAERFGLSQLHQLRGRIARGKFPGYCALFAEPVTDDSRRRLDAFVATTDGFDLAEADFAIRGPGDLFGTRQHGFPPLMIADLIRDCEILDEARRDAQALVAQDPGLALPEHARLRKQVLTRYGQVLDLGDVG